MEGKFVHARETASLVLSRIDPSRDETAVFRFDTQLDETARFTTGLRELPASMSKVVPFGATSLFDAIARTAERVAVREGHRHAVVVFTDGFDNASKLTPAQVSGIASSIDVPVYIVGVVSPLDDPTSEGATPAAAHSPLAGALANLAAWTGGGDLRRQQPRAARRRRPANRRRTAPSVPDRDRVGDRAWLAPADGEDAKHRSGRPRAKRILHWVVPAKYEVVLWRIARLM